MHKTLSQRLFRDCLSNTMDIVKNVGIHFGFLPPWYCWSGAIESKDSFLQFLGAKWVLHGIM